LVQYAEHPENVRALILICGSYGHMTSTFHGVPILEFVLPTIARAVLDRPNLARAVWSRISPAFAFKVAGKVREIDPERLRPEDFLPYLEHLRRVDLPMFLRMMRAAGEHTAKDILPRVKVPTLVIGGERDTFTPPFLAREMAEAIPGAELMIVERGSHVAFLEQHEIVNERIFRFLRERVLQN